MIKIKQIPIKDICSISLNYNGDILAIGDIYGKIYLFNIKFPSFSVISEIQLLENSTVTAVRTLALHPSDTVIASIQSDNEIVMRDYQEKKKVNVYLPGGSVRYLEFINNGRDMFVICMPTRQQQNGEEFAKIVILSYPECKEKYSYTLDTDYIRSDLAAISPDGNTLILCEKNTEQISIIEMNKKKHKFFSEVDFNINGVTLHPNGQFIVIAQSTNTIYDNIIVFDQTNCQKIKSFKFDNMSIKTMKPIINTNIIFAYNDNRTIFLIDLEKQHVLWKKQAYAVWPIIAVSGNGQLGVSVWDKGVLLIDWHQYLSKKVVNH
jgi:WD40 repeat protein